MCVYVYVCVCINVFNINVLKLYIYIFLILASAPRLVYQNRGMYYPVCGMMHIKEPLLLIGKSRPCGGSGFPLLLSEWSFTICVTPYNRK